MITSCFNALKEQSRIIRSLLLRANFWIVLFTDICLITAAYFLSNIVRYDFHLWRITRIATLLPFLIAVKLPVFYVFGLYRGMWRYTSLADLANIAKAISVSSGVIIMSVLYLNRFYGYSRTVFFLDGVLCFLFICIHRGTIRYLMQNAKLLAWFRRNGDPSFRTKRLLLIGAGAAAEMVIREIKDNQNVPFKVVGLVDDDPNKQGLKIHGIPVVGCVAELQSCAARTSADELLIAIASATSDQMKRLVKACRSTEIPYKVLPSMGEIIKGKLSVSAMREVDYRDLLGRPVVELDEENIGDLLTGRIILVTGAGGTIGAELCRQIVGYKPSKVILIDASEENLYRIQMELHHEREFYDCIPILGRIQNATLIESVFSEYHPSMVLHAAAYKHVPLIETNPWEAITNNVFGTKCLIDAAVKFKTERFVLVSTDKAVRPTNVMGASKRLTELLIQKWCCNKCDTLFMAVRFGNVLGSSGSVIPLFKRQIAVGGPVTITDPKITRYFMSIEEAAQLILQAGTMGEGGEIFILKMGQPVKILNLAKDLIALMGHEVGKDIEIVFTGLRPGEKLYEELITEGEGIVPTHHEKIMVLRCGNICYQVDDHLLDELLLQATLYDADGIKKSLQRLVPEYTPDTRAGAIVGARNPESFRLLSN